jgi:peroxiredoxin/mono/diheme cytochrome c family protein
MHRPTSTLFFVLGTVLALTALPAKGEEVPTEKINKKIDNVTIPGVDGKPFALHGLKGHKAVVVVFLSFDCPVSNHYAATLADLHKAYAGKGVAFVGVNSSDDLDAAGMARQAEAFKLPFPILKDEKHALAEALKAETAPEAFVLDPNFVLRYRGRIDNTFAARLKKNQQTTSFDLKAALDDLLAGKDVALPATRAIGCPIPRDRVVAREGKVTFYRDVLPILQNRCQSCHRPGEVGPFPLLTYNQAVNWCSDIKEYTQNRKMPPWKPVAGPAFHNERRLSDSEIATLASWVDANTPEGDPKDAPPAAHFIDGWQLGKPDLILSVDEDVVVGPGGRDLFRSLVLPTNLPEDKYVVAFEVRPGNARVLHHTLNFIDLTGKGRELEKKEKERAKKPGEQDSGPGYTVSMGIGFSPQGGLGGWAPGQIGRYLPEGTGYLLPKGADVIVQAHYHRTGRVEKDRIQIGLYFAKKPAVTRLEALVLPGRFVYIPAGENHFGVNGTIEILQDCTLHSVMPHMHMLGREIKVTITPPEGKPYSLIAIKDWDYNWQETYFLKESQAIKAGTRIAVEAFYDNTDKNPSNPNRPAKMVIFGEQTDNEMCFVFLGVTSSKGERVRSKVVDNRKPAEDKKAEDGKP